MDEAATPSDAPVVEVAEAPEAPAAPTESVAATPGLDGLASEATSPASGASTPEASTPIEGEITKSPYDEYNWDEWDGTHNSWPEEYQAWGAKLHGTLEKERADIESARELYSQMAMGMEDPRIAELTTTNGELTSKYEAQVAQLEGLQKASADLEMKIQSQQKAAEAFADQFAERHAELFERHNQDIFADDAKSARFVELMEAGVDADDAAHVARLEPTPYGIAQTALKEGSSVKHALQLAAYEQQRSKPRPRAGAVMTNGSGRRARPVQTNNIESKQPKSFDDIRNFAVAKALGSTRK